MVHVQGPGPAPLVLPQRDLKSNRNPDLGRRTMEKKKKIEKKEQFPHPDIDTTLSSAFRGTSKKGNFTKPLEADPNNILCVCGGGGYVIRVILWGKLNRSETEKQNTKQVTEFMFL